MALALQKAFANFGDTESSPMKHKKPYSEIIKEYRQNAVLRNVQESTTASQFFYNIAKKFSFTEENKNELPITPFWQGFCSTREAVQSLKNAGMITELAEDQVSDILENLDQSVKKLNDGVKVLSVEKFKEFFHDFHKRVAPQLVWLNEFFGDVVKADVQMGMEEGNDVTSEDEAWQRIERM